MDIIDEKGRLLGVVNVVDALVVLLAVAVVAAGVALVTGSGGSADDGTGSDGATTRYATLSYTVPLGSEATALAPDDTLSVVRGDESYAVTDVTRSFTHNGSVHVFAKVGYTGNFSANGGRVYGGEETALTTGSYRVDGDVHAVDRPRPTIRTRQVPVVLAANVSSSVARAIEAGQEATIANETVATVESVRRDSANAGDGRRQVRVGVELTVRDRSPVPAFGDQALRVDNRITVVTDDVVVRGRLHEVGTTSTSNQTET